MLHRRVFDPKSGLITRHVCVKNAANLGVVEPTCVPSRAFGWLEAVPVNLIGASVKLSDYFQPLLVWHSAHWSAAQKLGIGELKFRLFERCFKISGIFDPLLHEGLRATIGKFESGALSRQVKGLNILSADLLAHIHNGRNSADVAYEVQCLDMTLTVAQTETASELLDKDAP